MFRHSVLRIVLVKPIILVLLSIFTLSLGCGTSTKIAPIERAKVAFNSQNYVLARDLCDEVLETNPEDGDVYLLRGRTWLEEAISEHDRTLLDKEKIKKAIKDYSAAIRFRPIDSEPYYYRADAYAMIGDEKRARWDRRSAHETDPNYKKAFLFDQEQNLRSITMALKDSKAEKNTEPTSKLSRETSLMLPDIGKVEIEPMERHWNLNDVLDSVPEDKRAVRADDPRDKKTKVHKTVLDRLREDNYTNTLPKRFKEGLSKDLDKIRMIGPQLTTPSDENTEWLSSMKQFEDAYKSGLFGSSEDNEESDARLQSKESQAESDEESTDDDSQSPPSLIVPYQRRWQISGQFENSTRTPQYRNGDATSHSRGPFDAPPATTGFQSGNSRHNSASTTAPNTTNTLTSGALRFRQWSPRSSEEDSFVGRKMYNSTPQATPGLQPTPGAGQSEHRASLFRRSYLVPQTSSAPGFSRGTGIQSRFQP